MIELFRKGTSHHVHGVTCEKIKVNEFGFEPMLEDGWVLDPKELVKEKPKAAAPAEKVMPRTAAATKKAKEPAK